MYELPDFSAVFSAFTLAGRSATTRLFLEDPGVKGCGWFHRNREDRYHVHANVLRVACNVFFAPFLVLILAFETAGFVAYNLARIGWKDELVDVPNAVLNNPPKEDDSPRADPNNPSLLNTVNVPSSSKSSLQVDNDIYEKTNFEPRWMLRVVIRDSRYSGHDQIEWTEEHRGMGYTALSYDMEAAYTLFKEAKGTLQDPPPSGGAKFTLRDRKQISAQFLAEYCSAIQVENQRVNPNREEFVWLGKLSTLFVITRSLTLWLDEFCLSRERTDKGQHDDEAERFSVEKERSEELGRLADIFRGAETVIVFCDKIDCGHTNTTCRWGNRLFTLGEILHANRTQRMTRRIVPGASTRPQSYLYPESGRSFRERMMHEAAIANKWHLHAILRQSNNSGSDTWQMAIHALIVEAIKRDKESGYHHHAFIGKGLNGLLPRRAKLHHLRGKDGWADLAWLLELNQGFYNQAALAAVCCLPDNPEMGVGWLGPPIEPKPGNERLEPLVTAFTVGGAGKDGRPIAPLNIVGAQTIGLHPELRRDPMALFWNPHTRVLRLASVILLVLSWVVALLTFFSALIIGSLSLVGGGLLLFYGSSVAFSIFRLVVSAMYLERSGWVFLSERKWNDGSVGDAAWGSEPEKILGHLDPSLKHLVEWGPTQMAPEWDVPGNQYMRGHLVDLRTRVKVRVVVSGKPNSMVVLGVHGSGVTYMLLNRSENVHDLAGKVGLVNLPPFTLAWTEKSGSVRVGITESPKAEDS
ncbi:hypothetical protein VNI00_010151 [Paramarasmius palmivorus]|uniref:Uncharacterized protein n=1 Tax=Paramarasmius palmivorus TaxID=297713 RepID=A0AAW0CL73_9AGAR